MRAYVAEIRISADSTHCRCHNICRCLWAIAHLRERDHPPLLNPLGSGVLDPVAISFRHDCAFKRVRVELDGITMISAVGAPLAQKVASLAEARDKDRKLCRTKILLDETAVRIEGSPEILGPL